MNTLKHTFFCPDLNEGRLSDEESKHAVRVLRLNRGDEFTALDGQGRKCICIIDRIDSKVVYFDIREEEVTKKRLSGKVHVAIAPTKNIDRTVFFMEKAVELGVDRITPVITANSERTAFNHPKMAKKLIAAMKQCGNPFLPELDEATSLSSFLEEKQEDFSKYMAHCEADEEKKHLSDHIKSAKNALILIGPEGDFRKEEIILAKDKGFLPVSLGELTLRTETAGLIACYIGRHTFG